MALTWAGNLVRCCRLSCKLRDPVDAQLRPVLRVGGIEIREGLVRVEIREQLQKKGRVTAEVDPTAPGLLEVDWIGDAQVYGEVAGQRQLLFGGYVDSVVAGEPVVVELVDASQLLDDSMIKDLHARSVTQPEMIWTVVRHAGFLPEQVRIQGFAPREETFTVIAPIRGVTCLSEYALAEVEFLADGGIRNVAREVAMNDAGEALACYESASAWAKTTCTAGTLLDAERAGLQRIDAGIAWLTLVSHFSAARVPNGPVRRFQRSWTRSRLHRLDAVVVRGETTGRAWLRSPVDALIYPMLDLDEVGDLDSSSQFPMQDEQVRQAVLAWQRADEATAPIASIVYLWQAIEFFTAGTRMTPILDTSEMHRLRGKVLVGFDGPSRKRIADVLGMVNQAPLLDRLRHALTEDAVPYSEAEFDLLKRMRNARNDFVHGREVPLPNESDRRSAIALVGRMLMYRVHRLSTLAT